MSPVDQPLDDTGSPSQENQPLKPPRSKRRDRGRVRRGVSSPTDEDQESTRDKSSRPAFMGEKRGLRSQAVACRYIQENFEPEDWLAVVVRNHRTEETVQRITTARQIASPEFQSWLRHKNAQGSDIYLSLNTLREHANSRTKVDLKEIRHLYLDLDNEGQRRLARIYEDASVPHPNYVLQTSPGKYQVVWRVEGMAQKDAEDLLRSLARRFGGDPAATDATRVFRLPGFNNKKYPHAFQVKLAPGVLPDRIYHQSDFRIEPISSEPGSAIRTNSSGATGIGSNFGNSQSERDWAYAVRRLRRGDNPEDIVREIAAYRAKELYDSQDITRLLGSKKSKPYYYAEHTVSRAMRHLGMTKPTDVTKNASSETEPDR